MADPITEPQKSFHHLLVIKDGEVFVNELFHSKRDLAESFVTGLREDGYDIGIDKEDVEAAILDADQDAAAADYPEGVSPRVHGDPEEYLDTLADLLSENDIDLHVDTIALPEGDPA